MFDGGEEDELPSMLPFEAEPELWVIDVVFDDRKEKELPPILPPEAAIVEPGSYINNITTITEAAAGFSIALRAFITVSTENSNRFCSVFEFIGALVMDARWATEAPLPQMILMKKRLVRSLPKLVRLLKG